jgi:outer membrane protein
MTTERNTAARRGARRRSSRPKRAPRRTLWTVAVLCLAASARAEIVRLDSLESRAVRERATLRAEAARVEGARSEADMVRSARSPVVGLSLDASGSPGGKLIRVTATSGTDYFVAGSRALGESGAFVPEVRYDGVVTASGTLYDFGRTASAERAADARVLAARATREAAREAVVREVRAAYLEWLAATLLHGVAVRAQRDARAHRELVEARIASGARPPSDAPPARYDEALAALEEVESRGRIAAARLELARVAATKLDRDAEPDPALLDRGAPEGPVVETADTIALDRQHAAANAAARAEERVSAPILAAAAEAGVRGQAAHVFPSFRIGVSLSVPIWDGGVSSARAASSRAAATAVEAEAREQRAAIATEYQRAKIDFENAAERVRLSEVLVSAARVRVRDAEERYGLGDGKLEPVLDAAAAVTRAEREALSAKLARTDAALRLEAFSARSVVRTP